MKRFILSLLSLIFLTGCPFPFQFEDPDLDRECTYSKTNDYESDLPFSEPLFYRELNSYNYNGVEMDGFYFLGETEGTAYDFAPPSNPSNQTFLVNDKYNILTYVEMDNDIINIDDLHDENLRYSDSVYRRIEENILSNLLYEYYEDYFGPLNVFLEENNVNSFWDLEQMTCGRKSALDSIPLSHPNINRFVSMDLWYELNLEQKAVIASAIEDENLSVKTNSDLKLLIEKIIDDDKLNFHEGGHPGINITVAYINDVPSLNGSFDDLIQYENVDEEKFHEDLDNILNDIAFKFKEEGLISLDSNSDKMTIELFGFGYYNDTQMNGISDSERR